MAMIKGGLPHMNFSLVLNRTTTLRGGFSNVSAKLILGKTTSMDRSFLTCTSKHLTIIHHGMVLVRLIAHKV